MFKLIGSVFVCAIVGIFFASASYSADYSSPENTINAFILYDLQGARLGTDLAKSIDKLIHDGKLEPAWDLGVLVTGYELKDIQAKGKKAIATVEFKNAWEERRLFNISDVKDETITINLLKVKGVWKVTAPFYHPHIYANVLSMYYRQAIKEDAEKVGADWTKYTLNRIKNIETYQQIYKGM